MSLNKNNRSGNVILLGMAILTVAFLLIILYQTRQNMFLLIDQSADHEAHLIGQFEKSVRDYVTDNIRPEMAKRVNPGEFFPETMSSSFVARKIFDDVNNGSPDTIVRFATDNPRNPLNQANAAERQIIRFFELNPEAKTWTGTMQLTDDGEEYFVRAVPRVFTASCMECHGRPEDAPASLVERYGRVKGFGRSIGEVSIDLAAIPVSTPYAAANTLVRRHMYWIIGLCILFSMSIVGLMWIDKSRQLKFMQALRRSEKHFRTLVEGSPNSINMFDEQGRFLACNPSALNMMGLEIGDVLGKRFPEVWPEESRTVVENAIEQVMQGNRNSFEADFIRPDGRHISWWVVLYPLIEDDGSYHRYVSISTDISHRKQYEKALFDRQAALEREKSYLQSIFDAAPVGMLLIDSDTTVTYANRLASQLVCKDILDILGRPPGESISCLNAIATNQSCGETDHCTDCAIRNTIQQAFESLTEVHNVEFTQSLCINDEIHELNLSLSAAPISLRGTNQVLLSISDITDRKKAEESLIHHQQAITLNNRIANVFLSSQTDNIYPDVLGVILEELESQFGLFGYINDDGDLVCPSMTREVWEQCNIPGKSNVFPQDSWHGLWGMSLTAKGTLISNKGLTPPDGHVAINNAMASPIIHQGSMIGLFVVANKSNGYGPKEKELIESAAAQTAPVLYALLESKRKQLTQEKLEEQLIQAQKMESIGRLAGGVAHDFNNLLTIITGNCELAFMHFDSEEELQKDLSEIKHTTERATQITRQLLAFSRKQTISPVVLNLNNVIPTQEKMLSRLVGEDIHFSYNLANDIGNIEADPHQLDQIMMNLAVNARDAIDGVGSITIETSNARIDQYAQDKYADIDVGDYVKLVFSDSGKGMDAETAKNIFEPFFTTKKNGKGTGLGLATVYGIVKQNRGMVSVQSEPENGSSFTILLPRHNGSEKKLEQKETNASLHGDETVLIVEDERNILVLTEKVLTQYGYNVIACNSTSNAINIVKNMTDTIDLLLSDVVMPAMNGKQLQKEIEKLQPGIKTLFMSGYTANVIANHGIIDKGLNFIQKPFGMESLVKKVRTILDKPVLNTI